MQISPKSSETGDCLNIDKICLKFSAILPSRGGSNKIGATMNDYNLELMTRSLCHKNVSTQSSKQS